MSSTTAPEARGAPPKEATSQAAERDFARALYAGIAVWAALSALWLWLQGEIVLDETVIAGQIISGLVEYPGGHPHDAFYKTAYSLPSVAAGWFLSVWESEMALSAARNWVYLTLSLVSVFTVTAGVTRRAMWGHLATALILFDGQRFFAGNYPLNVFPVFYSHGHVGLQMAILTAGLLIARQWLVGGLVAGLLPAIHATMTLAVWPWMAVYLFVLARLGQSIAVRRAVLGCGLMVPVSVAVAFLIPLTSMPLPPEPPYDALAGIEATRAAFGALTDQHRMLPPIPSRAYLLGPVAFLALGHALFWMEPSTARAWTGRRLAAAAVAGFGALSLCIVYGGLVLEMALGGLPDILFMLMPYRFSNVPATLLIALGICLLASVADRTETEDRWVVLAVAALFLAALGVSMSGLLGDTLRHSVRLQMMSVVWGVPFGLGFWALASSARARWHLGFAFLAVIAAAAALWVGEKTALYLTVVTAASCVAAWFLARFDLPGPRLLRASSASLWVAAVCCAVGGVSARAAAVRAGPSDSAVVSADDRLIRGWLAANATPDELVLTSIEPRLELQATTRQPVLFEVETLWLMTYLPDIAPSIGTMVRDLYGIDYGRAAELATQCPGGRLSYWCDVWGIAWRSRTPAEWAALGSKYQFRIVIADSQLDLQLPIALRAGNVNLHVIAPSGEGPGQPEHPRAEPG